MFQGFVHVFSKLKSSNSKMSFKRYPYDSDEAEKLAETLWKISEEITQSKFN